MRDPIGLRFRFGFGAFLRFARALQVHDVCHMADVSPYRFWANPGATNSRGIA
jgi:hypothetical protein